MDQLADLSGYKQIALAPILFIGHSGGAIPAWEYGWWHPDRCFGVIGLHAAPMTSAPIYKGTDKNAPKPNIDYVPVLDISGQFETQAEIERTLEWHWRWVRGGLLEMRGVNKFSYVSALIGTGYTHFGWDDKHARYVAMFIQKAAHYRIPADLPATGQRPKLIDLPKTSGALTDITLLDPPHVPAAPYNEFKGDPTLAFWHLDMELAKATEAFHSTGRAKKVQLVTFVDDDKPLPMVWKQDVKFKPLDDGVTVKVKGDFIQETPKALAYLNTPTLGHADGPIQFRLMGGGEQLGSDTFRIKWNRFMYTKGGGNISVMAFHPGNDRYQYTEQICGINFPGNNIKGTPQTITFNPIANQKLGAKPVPLSATCDTGKEVEFFVLRGPAEVRGNTLTLSPALPPNCKLPVQITVVAYQWGRSVEPLFQSAKPVEQSFMVEP